MPTGSCGQCCPCVFLAAVNYDNATFAEAEASCQQQCAHLATFANLQEQVSAAVMLAARLGASQLHTVWSLSNCYAIRALRLLLSPPNPPPLRCLCQSMAGHQQRLQVRSPVASGHQTLQSCCLLASTYAAAAAAVHSPELLHRCQMLGPQHAIAGLPLSAACAHSQPLLPAAGQPGAVLHQPRRVQALLPAAVLHGLQAVRGGVRAHRQAAEGKAMCWPASLCATAAGAATACSASCLRPPSAHVLASLVKPCTPLVKEADTQVHTVRCSC